MKTVAKMLVKAGLAIFFLTAKSFSASMAKYRAGQFTNKAIHDLAGKVGGEFGGHLSWFADTAELFTFPGHDGLPLQGYYIPVARNSQRDPSSTPLPAIVHCAGWSETTIKYAKFLHILHQQGYPIYSFDIRGQGFSSETGFDKGVVTHVRSFNEYVDDLESFVSKEVAPRVRATRAQGDTSPKSDKIVYVANSVAALIGLTLQARSPVFDRLALVTPCIKPLGLPLPARAAISFARRIGLGSTLLVRLERDISKLKITHCPINGKAWRDLRDLVPERLVVQGPSVSFMRELSGAARNIRKVGPSITADVLILQAGIEIFVENDAMGRFFSSLGSKSAKLVRFSSAYHELLIETPDVFKEATREILSFLSVPSSSGPSGASDSGMESSALSYMLEL